MKRGPLRKSCTLILGTILILVLLSPGCSRKFMVVDEPAVLPPARILEHPPRVALVLGGGAFHGSAHVGVIKVLEDAHIPIDLIVGTSAGSMVGALYADFPHVDSLIPLVNHIKTSDVFDFSPFRSSEGYVSGKKLQKYLKDHLHHRNIEELPIPFVAVATDLDHGRSVPLAAGPIAPSVNASCAIPFIFEPVKMYGTVFVDGGVLNNIAIDVAKQYHPLITLAVDIMADFDTMPDFKNKTEVLQRCYGVASHVLKETELKQADILISPDLTGLPLLSAKDDELMLELGRKAALEALPKIQALLIEKGISR